MHLTRNPECIYQSAVNLLQEKNILVKKHSAAINWRKVEPHLCKQPFDLEMMDLYLNITQPEKGLAVSLKHIATSQTPRFILHNSHDLFSSSNQE